MMKKSVNGSWWLQRLGSSPNTIPHLVVVERFPSRHSIVAIVCSIVGFGMIDDIEHGNHMRNGHKGSSIEIKKEYQ